MKRQDVSGQNTLHTDGSGSSGTDVNIASVGGTPVTSPLPVSASSLPLPTGAATLAEQQTQTTEIGSLTETAPATDTASSGLNGRLQRIAQRLTSLIALLPAALGAGGGLKVDGSGTALPVSGTVTITPSGTQDENLKQVNGQTVDVGIGAAGTGTQRVTTSTDSTIGTVTTVTAVTAITNALPAGTALLGKTGIDQTTPGTTNAVSLAQIGATTVATGNGVVSAGVQRVAIASDNTAFAVNAAVTGTITASNTTGNIASDSPDSGNPVKIGMLAKTADIAAVADADRVDAVGTTLGKQITVPYSTPALTWSYAAAAGGLVTTGGVTAKAAGTGTQRNYVTRVQAINSHQTIGTEVVIRDGASGTVMWRGWAQFAGGGCSAVFDPPLRGSAATLIEIAEITTTATAGVLVNLQGYVASE